MADQPDDAALRRARSNKITFLGFFVTVSGLTAFDLYMAGRHVGYPSNVGFWVAAFLAATVTMAALVAALKILIVSLRRRTAK
jgi:hypothetical protein